jgi:hypothetical protein
MTDNNSFTIKKPIHISSAITFADRKASIMCRVSDKFRMKYKATPGLYSLGNPGKNSPVLVTANYKLSIDSLRAALKDRSVWILVVDTKGINVWCAAGKGTFCTKEIVKQITACDLVSVLAHRLLILPQLGASGVNATKLHKESGFIVKFGPVRASDLPQYLDNGNTATPEMRRVRFPFIDRLKLVPMEVIPAFKSVLPYLLIILMLFGITRTGILYKNIIAGGLPVAIAGLIAIFTGSVITPLFLPVLPFRAFTLKGFFSGLLGALAILFIVPSYRNNPFFVALSLVAMPTFSSYLAFLFTGCTTYTSPSGVKKELKLALPFYLVGAGISAVLFAFVLIRFWGVI